jgi:putative peptide zinc metalloprotease protein
VTELKPWVRKVVTGYICCVVPIIALLFVVMLIHAPRAFATGYDSFAVHYSRLAPDFSHGRAAKGILNIFEMLILVLPLMGMIYSVGRIAKRAGAGIWTWSADHPARRGGLALGTAAAIGLVAFLWWPHGDYRPIQPGEKGTVVSAVSSLPKVPTGRAALTPERARQLNGAPFVYHASTRGDAPNSEHTTTTPSTTATTPPTTTTTTTPATTTTTPATTTPATTTPAPATTTPAPTTTTDGTTTTP